MSSRTSVLTKALFNVTKEMGISTAHLGRIIGEDKNILRHTGIKPESKSGELALMLISCYRSLYVLVGGERESIQHWMYTQNKGTQGIPIEQITRVDGLVRVIQYLDAMNSK